MKNNKIDIETLLNMWLKKYHNTTIFRIKKENPKWAEAERKYLEVEENPSKFNDQEKTDIAKDLNKCSSEFYNTYKVTQSQYNEWEKEAKEYIRKVSRLPKTMIDRSWWSVSLNCSPSIIRDEK